MHTCSNDTFLLLLLNITDFIPDVQNTSISSNTSTDCFLFFPKTHTEMSQKLIQEGRKG